MLPERPKATDSTEGGRPSNTAVEVSLLSRGVYRGGISERAGRVHRVKPRTAILTSVHVPVMVSFWVLVAEFIQLILLCDITPSPLVGGCYSTGLQRGPNKCTPLSQRGSKDRHHSVGYAKAPGCLHRAGEQCKGSRRRGSASRRRPRWARQPSPRLSRLKGARRSVIKPS